MPVRTKVTHWRSVVLVAVAAASTAVTGCALVGEADEDTVDTETMTVTSPTFHDGGDVPDRYTCAGSGASPPLRWSGVPTEARALALVVDDPDATGSHVQWVVFNMDATATEIVEGSLPRGASQGLNTAGSASYEPPCPSSGRHRIRFTVYALREPVPEGPGAQLQDALSGIADRTVARGRLTAIFGPG